MLSHLSLHQPLDHPAGLISLPVPLALRLLPSAVHSRMLAGLLNHSLARQLDEGELDSLEGRTLLVRVTDAGIDYRLRLIGGRLQHSLAPPDIRLSGQLYDYLLLLTRREDPDSLFFQRRLSIQGDTGLGLTLKNFLDSLDWEELPLPGFAEQGLNRALDLYQRLLG